MSSNFSVDKYLLAILCLVKNPHPQDREVWEASVRATHLFLTEADIEYFKPLVYNLLPQVKKLNCVRDRVGQAIGFIGVVEDKIEMLFVHSNYRRQGLGRRLLEYAVKTLGATKVDVNEQNEQAVKFYRQMGFQVESRSDFDSMGKPFPLLHLRLGNTKSGLNTP